MNLEELKVYNLSMELGENVWSIVDKWNYFEKDTVGKQLVRSTDSIAANLSEGFGRFHFKEAKNFGYYSRGSLYETKTWLAKSKNRNLIEEDGFSALVEKINTIGKMLNNYIKSIGVTKESVGPKVNEPIAAYGFKNDDESANDQ